MLTGFSMCSQTTINGAGMSIQPIHFESAQLGLAVNTTMTASPRPSTADAATLRAAFRAAFKRELGLAAAGASDANVEAAMRAAAAACRDLLAERWARTQAEDAAPDDQRVSRRVHYLSMEFLMGRALGNALAALGLEGEL